jgi:hypothetical protein
VTICNLAPTRLDGVTVAARHKILARRESFALRDDPDATLPRNSTSPHTPKNSSDPHPAGTSEKGECVECGAPWRRQTQTTTEPTQRVHNGVYDASSGSANRWLPGKQTVEDRLGSRPAVATKPSSTQATPSPYPTRPQLVLDPFIGSGTTSLVARKHGRRSLGIDLSESYLAIAANRTQQLSLLGGAA